MSKMPTMSPNHEFAGRLMLLLTSLGNAVEARLAEEGVDPYVVRNTPLATLLLLRFEGPMRPSILSERVGMTTGGMTKVIDQLVERGLLSRQADLLDDGRAVMVSLTRDGHGLVDRVCSSTYPVLRRGADEVSQLEAMTH